MHHMLENILRLTKLKNLVFWARNNILVPQKGRNLSRSGFGVAAFKLFIFQMIHFGTF